MKILENNQVIVGPVRLSYANVFRPRKNTQRAGEPLEYSVVLMIPKEGNEFISDPDAEKAALAKRLGEVAVEKFGRTPGKMHNPLRNGDTDVGSDGEPKYPGYWFVNASAKEEYPPVIVDARARPLDESSGWGSGDWAKVKVRLYAYDNKTRGVGVGLVGVQFLAKDQPLGGGSPSKEGFDVEEKYAAKATASTGAAGDDYNPFTDDPGDDDEDSFA
jgi:hypothetical protein